VQGLRCKWGWLRADYFVMADRRQKQIVLWHSICVGHRCMLSVNFIIFALQYFEKIVIKVMLL
jgi:hypothetical protein